MYIICRKDGAGVYASVHPQVHSTIAAANVEAKRLASTSPNHTFFVFEAITWARSSVVVEEGIMPGFVGTNF